MNNFLEMLTESVLREALGPEWVDRAITDLNNGKVIRRISMPDGEITARWDNQANAPEMHARFQDDTLLTLCSCQQFQREGLCAHIAGLLVAWANQRWSFATISEEDGAGSPAVLTSQPAQSSVAPAQSFDPVQDYRRILNYFTLAELREMARLRGVPVSGIRKDPVVDTLAQAFSQRDKLRQDWHLLSPQARVLAGLLPFLTFVSNTASLEQAAQPFGVKGEAFTKAMDELKAFGLVYVETYGGIYYPAVLPFWIPPDPEFMAVPELDVTNLRVQPAPAPQSFYQAATRLLILLQAASEPYQARVDMHTKDVWKRLPFLQGWPAEPADVERLARESKPYQVLQQQGLQVAPAPSLLTNDAREKLAAAVQVSPEEEDFIIRLLHGYNLLQITPGKPVRPVQGTINTILQEEALQFSKELFARYASLETWTEIDLILAKTKSQPKVQPQAGPQAAPKAFRLILKDYNRGSYPQFVQKLSQLRERLLLLLRRLPAGTWYSLDGLSKRAAIFPLRAMLHRLVDFGYFEINGHKINLDRPDDIQQLIARLLEAMLVGPLSWQGSVDLAWEKDHLSGFRLTDLGGALLAQAVDFQMPKPAEGVPALEFTPDGSLALQLEAASSMLIGLLVLLGDVEVSRQGGIIIRPGLIGAGRAFEAGWSAERILNVLATETGRPVPPGLVEKLQRWWQNFGSVNLYQNVAMMEFGDDFALSELLAGTSLSRHLLYRFSPRLIAIRPEGAAELREELVKKGYTPKTTA